MRSPPPRGPSGRANHDAALAWLLEHYAYMGTQGSGQAVELGHGAPEVLGIPVLRQRLAGYKARGVIKDTPTSKGRRKEFHPVDAWAEQATYVHGIQCRPDQAWPVFTAEDGQVYANTWVPFSEREDAGLKGGRIELFLDFMKGLLPDDREREHMLDQFACKVQHPEIPGIVPLFMAPNVEGVGRDTLFDVAKLVIGPTYAIELTMDVLMSPYNDFMLAPLAFLSETRGAQDDYKATRHKEIMERLKPVFEPRMREVRINPKFGRQFRGMSCSSLWVATNHLDAIPVRKETRRVNVYMNGQPREPAFYTRLRKWMAKAANIVALRNWLLARDLAKFDPYQRIDTEARQDMIEASTSEFERAVIEAQARLGRVVQFGQVMRMAYAVLYETDYSVAPHWKAVVDNLLRSMLFGLRMANGKRFFTWSQAEREKWRGADDSLVLGQLAKNEAALKAANAPKRYDIDELLQGLTPKDDE